MYNRLTPIFLASVTIVILTIAAYYYLPKFFIVREKSEWWKTMSLYHLYPRSFKDSDGDGVGDIKGIKSNLQYLVDSKFNAFWLSPIYQSPMVDFGYDITDFTAIDPTFGTMEDFEELLQEAHRLNLKVIMDFVPNHSSYQHEWFQKSIEKIDPYTDYYVWHPGKVVNGTRQQPNNWVSVMHGVTWTWNEKRQAYYFHHFRPEQPDLNFRCKHVVEEMKNVIRFWLDKGVDGFRVDAIADLFEDEYFRSEALSGISNDPANWTYTRHDYTNNLPETYNMVRQWRNILDEYDSRFMAVEIYGTISVMMRYYAAGAHFPFNYDFVDLVTNSSTARDFRDIIDNWMVNLPEGTQKNWGAGNHDRWRLFTHFGRDFGQAVIIMVQLLPGVAITYYGEELGMENSYTSWEETKDPWALNVGPERFKAFSRDNLRRPFPWDNSTSAGFSTNPITWLPVSENDVKLNLATQKDAEKSFYKSFLKITSLREWPAVKFGSLHIELLNEDTVLAFSRELKNERSVYVIVNFLKEPQTVGLQFFKTAPSKVIVYHVTADTQAQIGQIVKSSNLHVPGRGAAIFVTL